MRHACARVRGMMTILNIFVYNIYKLIYNLKRTVKSLLKDLFVFYLCPLLKLWPQAERGERVGEGKEGGREGGEKEKKVRGRTEAKRREGVTGNDAMGRENDLVGPLGRRYRRRRELH